MAGFATRSLRSSWRNFPVLLKQVAACVGTARYSKGADREVRPLKHTEKDSANRGKASHNWRVDDVNFAENVEIAEEKMADLCKESADFQVGNIRAISGMQHLYDHLRLSLHVILKFANPSPPRPFRNQKFVPYTHCANTISGTCWLKHCAAAQMQKP